MIHATTPQLTRDDIRLIVTETINEQRRLQADHIDATTMKIVATILTSFGIDERDRVELRADLVHLRKWRKGVETISGTTFKVIVTVLITGILSAIGIGIKMMFGR